MIFKAVKWGDTIIVVGAVGDVEALLHAHALNLLLDQHYSLGFKDKADFALAVDRGNPTFGYWVGDGRFVSEYEHDMEQNPLTSILTQEVKRQG